MRDKNEAKERQLHTGRDKGRQERQVPGGRSDGRKGKSAMKMGGKLIPGGGEGKTPVTTA